MLSTKELAMRVYVDYVMWQDPCTTVWCRVDKKCLTRLEAAAAGTLCGTDEVTLSICLSVCLTVDSCRLY